MGDTILVNSANQFAEGIQVDFSFQQHGEQLYVSGYGYIYTQRLLKYVSWGSGTPFGISFTVEWRDSLVSRKWSSEGIVAGTI